MAYRTSVAEVREILPAPNVTDAQITAFIKGANALVSKALTSSGLGDTLMAEIERWMTAHMLATTMERMATKEGAAGAYVEYTGKYGQGLEASPYGQQVLMLDTSGALASLSKGKAPATIIAVRSFDT